ncbi:potassium channel family protein [Thermanaerovibrio acidaminovorans]|uniref:potassium channel family protein n=1 Tax=Thermanaerovibrio acidaminovorans TaxID=81462 RepID=UPI00248FAF28|nr:potassium channel protein [Thermanaerovibrio acidaminovorans]
MQNKCSGARRVAVIALILASLITVGVLEMRMDMGLSWVDSFFYTVTTLATVGFEAPPNLTDRGKVILVLLIIVGFGVMAYSIGEITRYFVEDRILTMLGRRRDRMLNTIRDHWIICGLGRVGTQIAETFASEGVPFVAIERGEQAMVSGVERGWLVVNRNATEERALEEAGITRARGLIATLSSDPDNVYVVLCARALNMNLKIIARANDPQSSNALYRAGANKVINPLVAGLSLAQANMRRNFNMLALAVDRKGKVVYNPPADFVLQGGDELLFLCQVDHVEDLRRLLTGNI